MGRITNNKEEITVGVSREDGLTKTMYDEQITD
jgi:hypothetical protein